MMERLEMIQVGENGQLYFDFDALEAMTSAEFVEQVKKDVESRSILSARVEVQDKYVVVYLFDGFGFFIQHTFSSCGWTDRKMIALHDFYIMSEMLREVRQ